MLVALVIAGISVLLAAATFGYDFFLKQQLARKEAALAEAQARINTDTIEEFIRLRDRLSVGKELLDNHVRLTQFLTVLETATLQNVRFETMSLVVAGDRTATIEMTGTARSFNALAAQSTAFAAEKNIKRAIFSGIALTEDNAVTFSMTADIDAPLITEDVTAAVAAPAVVPVPSTASTTGTNPVAAPVQRTASTTP